MRIALVLNDRKKYQSTYRRTQRCKKGEPKSEISQCAIAAKINLKKTYGSGTPEGEALPNFLQACLNFCESQPI